MTLPDWPLAVWINVVNSISVALCFTVFLIFGHIRRRALHVVQDAERWAVTGVIMWVMIFFISRSIQVGMKGMTVADPWFLAVGVLGSIICWTSVAVLIYKRGEYGVWDEGDRWKPGDPERRTGVDRRQRT